MRRIVLHGSLRKFGEYFEMDVATAAEAVRAIGSQIPEFYEHIRAGAYHIVRCARHADPLEKTPRSVSLESDDLSDLKLGRGDLHIIPVVRGAKRGGFLKIILGIALIGAALFFSGGALATPLVGSVTYGNVAAIGVAMVVSGISQMLTPHQDKDKDDSSYTSSGPSNTGDQGAAVPLNYGQCFVGGVLISAGMSIEQLK